MALTTCSDCGNQISTEASACPNCGKPLPKNRSSLKGLLIAGGVLLLLVVAVAFLVVVQKRNAALAMSEAEAQTTIHTIAKCEMLYQLDKKKFGDLRDLVSAGLLDRQYATGTDGYIFSVQPGTRPASFVVTAKPTHYGFWGSGRKSFYMSSDDTVMHGADKGGNDATASDPAETY